MNRTIVSVIELFVAVAAVAILLSYTWSLLGGIERGKRECTTGLPGVCSGGTQTFSTGVWGDCVPDTKPSGEICNLQDDDCDGVIDEACAANFDLEIANVTKIGVGSPSQFSVQMCVNGDKSFNDIKPSLPGVSAVPFTYGVFDSAGNRQGDLLWAGGAPEALKSGQCGNVPFLLTAADQTYFDQTKKLEVTLDGTGLIPETNEGNNTFLYQECIPKTCADLGKYCGTWPDGCGTGNTITCNTPCPIAGQTCNTTTGQCEATAAQVCSDTDVSAAYPDGKNKFTKGTVTISQGGATIETKTDFCTGLNTQYEYACNGNSYSGFNNSCPNAVGGVACIDGACISNASWIQVGPPHTAWNNCNDECALRGLQCKDPGCPPKETVTGGEALGPSPYNHYACSIDWGNLFNSQDNYCCCGS